MDRVCSVFIASARCMATLTYCCTGAITVDISGANFIGANGVRSTNNPTLSIQSCSFSNCDYGFNGVVASGLIDSNTFTNIVKASIAVTGEVWNKASGTLDGFVWAANGSAPKAASFFCEAMRSRHYYNSNDVSHTYWVITVQLCAKRTWFWYTQPHFSPYFF